MNTSQGPAPLGDASPETLGCIEHAGVTLTPALFDPAAPTQTRLGAFDADGRFLDGFRMLRGDEVSPRVPLDAPAAETLRGTWIYGGVLRPHYGHFLLESLSRAWFLRRRPDLPILWHAANGRAVLSPWHREVFAMLGMPEGRMQVILRPTAVERVLLPDAGCVIERRLHPVQARALAVFPAPAPRPGRRLWLSRSRLPDSLSKIEGEAALEAHLEVAGWTILHPQTLPVWRQLAAMADAEEIAGFEGSAFHSVLLLDGCRARLTLLRRSAESFPASHALITDALGIDHRIITVPLRPGAGEGRRRAVVLADPQAASCTLLTPRGTAAPLPAPVLPRIAPPPASARGLAFIHIPKTAGTAFTQALAAGWPRVRIVGTQAAFDAIPDAEFADLDLVAGHFYAFRLEQRGLAGFAPLTILRDPFERLFSAYRFGRQFARRGAPVGPAMRLAGELGFGAWAFAPGAAAHRHAQLYQLGLDPQDRAAVVPLATLLDRAKARLDRIMVGTAEELPAFLDFVFRSHGRETPPPLGRAMTTGERYPPEEAGLTAAERQALMETLRPDYALLEHARALMRRRLDAAGTLSA